MSLRWVCFFFIWFIIHNLKQTNKQKRIQELRSRNCYFHDFNITCLPKILCNNAYQSNKNKSISTAPKHNICIKIWYSSNIKANWIFSSVQFSRSVVSDSFRPYEPQYARSTCPSPTAGVYSNPCSLSRWCHPAISSSVIPFSSHLQSFPQHQGLFKWVSSSHHVAKVLEFQFQHKSFQWTHRTDLL